MGKQRPWPDAQTELDFASHLHFEKWAKVSADGILKQFSSPFFFPENMNCHFMQIIS